MDHVVEVPQLGVQHKVEEATEGPEHDYKLHYKCSEANEAKLDGCCDLFEGFLETEKANIQIDRMIDVKNVDLKIKNYLKSLHNFRSDVKTVIETTSSYCPLIVLAWSMDTYLLPLSLDIDLRRFSTVQVFRK